MLKKTIVSLTALLGIATAANGQVANYALSLSDAASVNCGPLSIINGESSYTVQLWMCPEKWTPNATLLGRGAALSLSLAQAEGALNFTVGDATMNIASSELTTGQWAQVTIVCDNGNAIAYVNNKQAGTATLPSMPANVDNFTMGGNYTGRIDEVRIWKTALADKFNRFVNNTLNEFNPYWDELAAYWKMDQNLCDNLVDYKTLELPAGSTNNHGIMTAGATRTLVNDNSKLPYLINGAYTANERFYDRAISREQYLLSNDLIILGVEFAKTQDGKLDGHVQTVTPNNHATISGGVKYMAEHAGRKSVASFDGTGLMTAPRRTLAPTITDGLTNGYTFETWFYVDEWVKDAYLFKKETADGKQGFSVRLGDEGQIYVRCNGNEYGAELGVTAKEWHHIGIVPTNGGNTRTTYLFVYDGTGKRAKVALSTPDATDCTPLGIYDIDATLGQNFKGKLDDTMIWDMNLDASLIKQQSEKVPMPGFGIVLTSYIMQKANTCYLYEKPEDLGFSSYSQDNWRDIMMAAYDGYRGANVRISVKSADGWQNCIANAQYRKNFAQDLGEIAKGYHGVELDLEWMDGKQTNLGLLAKEIRSCLPEGKTFFVSCHAYGAYMFPLDDMQYVDGFTFQQYGPQNSFFQWNNYLSSTKAFQNYGFPNDKIMTSYATTTSEGTDGSTKTAIQGVKDGFFTTEGFKPEDNKGEKNGYTFYFTGPDQTYKRAAYCVDNLLQGIFYWDMGNDLPVSNEYNLARWASYALNANVDPLVTSVEVIHSTNSLSDLLSDSSSNQVHITHNGNTATAQGLACDAAVAIYNIAGMCLSRQEVQNAQFDISALPSGVYVANFTTKEGNNIISKFNKN